MTGFLEVVDAGSLTTVQDAGRSGLAHLGIAPSGYLDVPAAELANRLVGNEIGAALLETTGRGPTLRLRGTTRSVLVAVTGAPAPLALDGRPVDQYAPVLLREGQQLSVGAATRGLRSYVAVQGGIAVAPVLGSRAADLLSGLGPPPLSRGGRLPLAEPSGPAPAADPVAVAPIEGRPILGIQPGPRDGWFAPETLGLLTDSEWTVSPDSSRVGVRLQGPILTRVDDRELPPEGMVTGALQIPPNGQPVLLLADHPTTGGYPVLAVVRERDLHFAAQAAPGTTIRFRAYQPKP